jgi:hypothetical protein
VVTNEKFGVVLFILFIFLNKFIIFSCLFFCPFFVNFVFHTVPYHSILSFSSFSILTPPFWAFGEHVVCARACACDVGSLNLDELQKILETGR